jgi:hypothetical protein
MPQGGSADAAGLKQGLSGRVEARPHGALGDAEDVGDLLSTWPANQTTAVSKIPLEGEPRKLFVEGNQALVYVAVPAPSSKRASSYSPYGGNRECTYGYDCVPSGDGTMTKILVFDITNRAAPRKVRELELSGSLLAARRIGRTVHTVVVDAPAPVEGLEAYPTDLTCDPTNQELSKARSIQAWQDLRARNLTRIAQANLDGHMPSIKEGGMPATGACGGYFRPHVAEGRSFTSVVSLDMAGGAPKTATVISDPGVVYASATALYMSVPHTRSDG